MEKEFFIDVLKHYSKSSENEAVNIESLKETYPYSQVLRALAAKLGKDHQLVEHQKSLQSAAVYAADRSVLKSVMNGDELVLAPIAQAVLWAPRAHFMSQIHQDHVEPHSFKNATNGVLNFSQQPPVGTNGFDHEPTDIMEPLEAPQHVVPEVVPHIPAELKGSFDFGSLVPKEVPTEAGTVADEVMSDLERLNQLKHDFEVLYATTKINQAAADLAAEQYNPSPEPPKEIKVERLMEMDNALDNQPAEAPDVPQTPPVKPSLLRRKFGANDAFIDEIVNRKELEPENNKQREQLEMIDQFIKTQPSISPNKDKVLEPSDGDLTTIKSGEFTDNIVSETLVEILIKQGKKDKAIEVLKKLIWKFPQKKAYFAAQIEDLKK